MEDFIPYELTDDDDTEELPAREIYRPIPEDNLEISDYALSCEDEVYMTCDHEEDIKDLRISSCQDCFL